MSVFIVREAVLLALSPAEVREVVLRVCLAWFLIALWNFYKAEKTNGRMYYSNAFRTTGHGLILLGLLQLYFSYWLDGDNSVLTWFTIIFFIGIGATLTFGRKRLLR